METKILEDAIHMVSLTENIYLQRQLEKIQKVIRETPNDAELGAKLRQIL